MLKINFGLLMNRMITLLALATAVLSMAACGGKKEETTIIAKKAETKKPSSPVRMQDYEQNHELDLGGIALTCRIHRSACDSLPMVTDENGQKFVDNTIRVTIKRSDGSVFFEKTFTKKSFDGFLDDDYRRTGILEGLVFDKVDGSVIRLAASVSHPQTDEYLPFVVSLSKTGKLNIERDTQLDISSTDDAE